MVENPSINSSYRPKGLINLAYRVISKIRAYIEKPINRIKSARELAKIINFLDGLPKRTGVFFDIGANIGDKTAFYTRVARQVVAVEPQRSCVESLKARFGNEGKVAIVDKAIGATSGEKTLYISSRYPGFSSFNSDWQKGTKYNQFDKNEKVSITTLDELIRIYGIPDFCKIDVEGYESEVIAGLSTKIPCLNFEFHGNDLHAVKVNIDKLSKLGFREFNFTYGENYFDSEIWMTEDNLLIKLEGAHKKIGDLWGDIYAK